MSHPKDILDSGLIKYLAIPECYRKAFWVIFIITTLVFSPIIMWSLFGNHDLGFFRLSHRFAELGTYGRPLAVYPIYLTNGFILPITYVLSYFFFALSAVLFCALFKLPKRQAYYYLVGLLITLHPYVLSKLYYGGMLDIYIGPIFVFGGFLFYQKRVRNYTILTFSCFLIPLAMYTSFINTIAMTLILILLHDLCFEKKCIKELFYEYIRLALIIAGAMLTYLFYIKIGQYFGFINIFYTTTTHTDLSKAFYSAPSIMWANFGEYINLQVPIRREMKIVGSLLVLSSFILIIKAIIQNKKDLFSKLVLAFILMVYILFFHNLVAFITDNPGAVQGVNGFRISFHGVLFIYPFAAIALLRSEKLWIINSCIVAISVFAWWMMLADFRAQQVWKLSLDSEYYSRNRILARMENLDGFDMYIRYNLVQVGYLPIWSDRLFSRHFDLKTAELGASFDFDGHQGDFFRVILPILKFNAIATNDPLWKEKILNNQELLKNSKAWPAKNSVFLKDDTIFLIFDKHLLDTTLDSAGNK